MYVCMKKDEGIKKVMIYVRQCSHPQFEKERNRENDVIDVIC